MTDAQRKMLDRVIAEGVKSADMLTLRAFSEIVGRERFVLSRLAEGRDRSVTRVQQQVRKFVRVGFVSADVEMVETRGRWESSAIKRFSNYAITPAGTAALAEWKQMANRRLA